MPAPQAQDERRARALTALFWGGVGLVPLTLLIVMVGPGTGSLRVAVIFGLLSMVAIGVSITLRRESETVRVDLEHFIFDQLDQVRAEVRADVTTASRNTYHALRDQLAALAERVETLRLTLEEALTEPTTTAQSGAGGPGTVHRTETVHVTRRTTTVDTGVEDGRGTVYGSRAAAARDEPAPVQERDRDRDRGRDRYRDDDEYEERPRRRSSHHDDRRDDDRYDDDRRRDARRSRDEDDDRRDARRSRDERRRADDRGRDRDDRWEGSSSADRWASIRDDGQKVRMRERRSSMRSDGNRREVHIEDRWAELRRDPDDGDGGDWEETFRSLRRPPELPPAPGESARPYIEGSSREYEHNRDGPPRPRSPHPSENDDRR